MTINGPRSKLGYQERSAIFKGLAIFSTEFRQVLRQKLVAGTMYGLKMYGP